MHHWAKSCGNVKLGLAKFCSLLITRSLIAQLKRFDGFSSMPKKTVSLKCTIFEKNQVKLQQKKDFFGQWIQIFVLQNGETKRPGFLCIALTASKHFIGAIKHHLTICLSLF